CYVQARLDASKGCLEQGVVSLAIDGVSKELPSRSNRNLNCAGANFGDSIALSLSDLLLGKCGTSRHVLLGASLGFCNQGLGLVLGRGNDLSSFLLGFLTLLLVVSQQLRGFFTELACLFQLIADLLRTAVECLVDHRGQAREDHKRKEQDETNCSPECCVHDLSSSQP